MMFSTWWPHSISNHSRDKTHDEAENTTSFRLPKTSSSHSSDSQSSKDGKKRSKRKSKKVGSKSKKTKRQESQRINSSSQLRFVALDSLDEDTCTLTPEQNGAISNSFLSGKHGPKEQCKVVNLKIPLPSQTDTYTLQVLKQKQAEQTSKLKSLQGLESPRVGSSRKKISSGREEKDQEKQHVLKSVELVNFANEEQSATNLYMQHQRTLAKSNCITVPSLTKSSFLVNLTHRPGSASTWKDIHPPPSPLLQHTPIHSPRKLHPSTEYPDLVLSSKQLPSHIPVDSLSAHHSLHSMKEYIFRPVFRYSHLGSSIQSSPKHCSCTDGCQRCLTSTTRLIHPSSLTLDSCNQLHDRINRDKLTKSSCKLFVKGNGSSVSTELPPLEAGTGDSERDIQSLSLQAQGLSIMRHHLPKNLSTQRRIERVPLGSATTYTCRPKKEVSKYPDPLVGGLPSYHRRLAQMATLVTETIRLEKEKALKTKSKKAANGSSTPRSGNNGSLGSL